MGDCQVRRVDFVLQMGSACLYENFGHVCSWLSRAKAVQQLEYMKINFDGEGTIDHAMIVLLPGVTKAIRCIVQDDISIETLQSGFSPSLQSLV